MDSAEPSLFDMTQRTTKRASRSSESQGQTPPEGSRGVSPRTFFFFGCLATPCAVQGMLLGRKVKGRCKEEGGQYRWLSEFRVSIGEGAQYVE